MNKEEQNLNNAESPKLDISGVSVRFPKTLIGSKESVEYLKSVGRYENHFWFPPSSHDIIHYANEVWNELNAH